MWPLIYKEFIQVRLYFLSIAGGLVVSAILFGFVPLNLQLYFMYGTFGAYAAVAFPQLSFAQEERGNAWLFLRSLPVRPREIVGSKYVASLIPQVVLAASLPLFGWLSGAPEAPVAVRQTLSVYLLMGTLLSAPGFFLYFLLGPKQAKSIVTAIIMGLMLVLNIAGMVLFVFVDRFRPSLREIMSTVSSVTASPWFLVTSILVSAGLLSLSYLASTQVYTRRDISRQP